MILCKNYLAASSPKTTKEYLEAIFNRPRCNAPAVWMTPFGGRCAPCMVLLDEAAQSDETLLGLLRSRQGIHAAIPKVPIVPDQEVVYEDDDSVFIRGKGGSHE
jgi:hypothetical protein